MQITRNHSFDAARGLAMLIIISWHTLGVHNMITDPWVMPIFFFIVGYFWKENIQFKPFVTHKLNKLIKPLIYFSIPSFFILLTKVIISQDYHPLIKLLSPYDSIIVGGWFIPCIIMSYICYWIVDFIIKNKNEFRWIIVIVFSTIGYMLDEIHIGHHRIILPFYTNTALFVMIFIELGRNFKSIQTRYFTTCLYSIKTLIISTILFIISLVLFNSKPLDFIWSDYQGAYWIVIVLEATLSIITLLSLFSFFKRISLLEYFGRQSLGILLLHGYIIDILILIGFEHNIYLYIVTIILTYWGVKLIQYFIPKILP